MSKGRLEAFSDGVIAILITIMVLELAKPAGPTFGALRLAIPSILWYLLSFVFLGIYWNNHHHMFSVVRQVNGWVLWANLLLLFWLSLIPYATDWWGQSYLHQAPMQVPTVFYGVVLLASGISYFILQRTILGLEGPRSDLAQAVGADKKGQLSLLFYATALGAAYYTPWIADAIYVLVALIWIVPDRRIERRVQRPSQEESAGPPH